MRDVRQDSSDYVRRWFFDENFDLIAWYAHDGTLSGFQLCYDKAAREKALTWFSNRGLSHHLVDPGDQCPWVNRSPMLVASDGRTGMTQLLASFVVSDGHLPSELSRLVGQKIKEYGRQGTPHIRYWQAVLPIVVLCAVCLVAASAVANSRRRRKSRFPFSSNTPCGSRR